MPTLRASIQRHPLLTYFTLAFAISWGGILVAVGPTGIPGSPAEFDRLLMLVVLPMLAGPSVAGLLLTGVVQGRAGYRALLARLLKWRVGVGWYAVALLTAPVVAMVTLFALSVAGPEYRPGILAVEDKSSQVLFGLVVGLAAGVFEELGWTGFALPRMRARQGALAAGLTLGLLWGAWHFLASSWGSSSSIGSVPVAVYMTVVLFSFLPPYRMLMVWVHDRTQSLLVAMLMHAALTASMLILQPQAIAGTPVLVWNLAYAAALWVIVAAVSVASRARSPEQAPRVLVA